MRQLPFDYSRCLHEACQLRARCLRQLSPGRPEYQLYLEFPGGEDCHGFIDASED